MKDFKLDGPEFIALCDLMKLVGMTDSGAEAKHVIAEGKVSVDGEVELRKRYKVRAGQVVQYQDFSVKVI
jgi:ribosome-associated protein